MDDPGSFVPAPRGGDLPGGGGAQVAGRRPTPGQRRREAAIDRQLERIAAAGGFVLSSACAVAGAWAAFASWGSGRFALVTALGSLAAVGGAALALHFVVSTRTTGTRARTSRITGLASHPVPATTPLEAWVIAVLIGALGGGATGIDLGTLVLIVGGRTPWNLPPPTVMIAVVVLPIVGLVPLAAAAGAAARRAWLRRPVLAAAAAWVAGSVAGTAVSGVWSHLPGV